MEILTMLAAGGVIWAIIWVLYVLLQTLIYGALTCATAISGLYIGGCTQTSEMFMFGDVSITAGGIVAFFLAVATFKFLARFWNEASVAIPKIVHPFGGS